MWKDHHWVHVTEEQANKDYPEKVSAHSEIFFCELCGQGVTFAKGKKYRRYFKHEPDIRKPCPEKTNGSTYYSHGFEPKAYQLPIRVKIDSHIEFFIGLINIPKEDLSKAALKTIEIRSRDPYMRVGIYNFERLRDNGITYLRLGSQLAPSYQLIIDQTLKKYWPTSVDGLRSEGTLFDERTGKLLVPDSDITINHWYILITSKQLPQYGIHGIQYEQLGTIKKKWNVYKIKILEYSEYSAKLFLRIQYRLTDSPVYIQPIWPLYQKTPYLIQHNRDFTYFYVNGDLNENQAGRPTTKVFPFARLRKFQYSDDGSVRGSVIQVQGNERQQIITYNEQPQIIAVGRMNVLNYTYFKRSKTQEYTKFPKIEVKDIHGNKISDGIQEKLPDRGIIQISTPYDGTIIIKKDEKIIGKKNLIAGEMTEINNNDKKEIGFGNRLIILQGLDIVYDVFFMKKASSRSQNEEKIILQLERCQGRIITETINLGRVFQELKNYPKLQMWFKKKLRQVRLTEEMLILIKRFLFHKCYQK